MCERGATDRYSESERGRAKRGRNPIYYIRIKKFETATLTE
ncbi:hypothetical protein BIW11_04049 [Tropilaelaps mercedesae]|uniref:Uncharacterized protein n=1 Tax=Tropilaelaps mercedesae TaxID=418985 RepID=A0A1V9XBW3_9ACAR|nr:hypothetical protein BIW11_04049 [Tropilaelaps mercedesae]